MIIFWRKNQDERILSDSIDNGFGCNIHFQNVSFQEFLIIFILQSGKQLQNTSVYIQCI